VREEEAERVLTSYSSFFLVDKEMNIGSSASSSSAYGAYYDPFYPNGGPSTWAAYPPPQTLPPQSSVSSSGHGPCLISGGPKGLSASHFTPVHQQRRKRRVLFTQAQVRVM